MALKSSLIGYWRLKRNLLIDSFRRPLPEQKYLLRHIKCREGLFCPDMIGEILPDNFQSANY